MGQNPSLQSPLLTLTPRILQKRQQTLGTEPARLRGPAGPKGAEAGSPAVRGEAATRVLQATYSQPGPPAGGPTLNDLTVTSGLNNGSNVTSTALPGQVVHCLPEGTARCSDSTVCLAPSRSLSRFQTQSVTGAVRGAKRQPSSDRSAGPSSLGGGGHPGQAMITLPHAQCLPREHAVPQQSRLHPCPRSTSSLKQSTGSTNYPLILLFVSTLNWF